MGECSGTNKCEKILKQIEYYFGDINLPRDKFLQEELKKDSGWVPISTLLTFNRLKSITNEAEEIAVALKTSCLIDVSEDNSKIKRKAEIPLPEDTLEFWQEIKKRTVIMNGFPETTTLDEVQDFVKDYGRVENIIMRKTKTKEEKSVYKGSSLVTFPDVETAQKFSEISDLKFKDFNISTKMQEKYIADKKYERSLEKEIKKQKKREIQSEQRDSLFKAHYTKGAVLKSQGFPKEATIDEIRKFFEPFGHAEYITFPESDEGKDTYIRFSKENEARDVIDGLEKAEESGTNIFKEQKITAVILDEAEEEAYWSEFSKKRQEKQKLMSKRGKGNKKFLKRDQRNNKNFAVKRLAEEEGFVETKKARRIVFNDDECVSETKEGDENKPKIEQENSQHFVSQSESNGDGQAIKNECAE